VLGSAAVQAGPASEASTLPPGSYAVNPEELITLDGLSSGGGKPAFAPAEKALAAQATRPASRTAVLKSDTVQVQKFGPQTFVPGRTYLLKFKARAAPSDKPMVVAMHFLSNDRSQVFRSFPAIFKAADGSEQQIRFIAPAFVGAAELAVASNGNQLTLEDVSLKMQEPMRLTEPIASREGSYVPSGYQLAFNDEFNGATLNRDKWFTRYLYENGRLDHLQSERQRYSDNDNHQVANGVLSLVARKAAGGNYESGAIRSDWTTRYGYFEARVKMPSGKGVFPAFWLNPDADDKGKATWPPEIDIFEMVNDGNSEKTNMLHTGVIQKQAGKKREYRYTDPAFDTKWSFWRAPFRFDEGWHTIGAEWTPDSVTTFVDGKKIVTFGYEWNHNNGTLAEPAHIILNLAIGGDWAGRNGIDDSAFPQALQVDWVRAYKKAD